MKKSFSTKLVFSAVTLFILIVGAIFLFKSFFELNAFLKLSEKVPISSIKWEIIEVKEGKFRIKTDYSYVVNGETLHGSAMYNQKLFFNHLAASSYAKQMQSHTQKVFYNNTNPLISAPWRHFPYKNCFRAFIVALVFIYFIFFQRYIEKILKT